YFSPKTRDYFADEFITSYRGILILLMQKHLEYQVVTPRTLAEFQGSTLVLPDVRVLDDNEKASLQKYVSGDHMLVLTGSNATGLAASANVVEINDDPGREYFSLLKENFEGASPDQEQAFLDKLKSASSIRVIASPMVATSISRVEGAPHVFFANFAGLVGGKNMVQTPQKGVQVQVDGLSRACGFFLPFLGEVSKVNGVAGNGGVTFDLPPIEKGGVFWWERR
ncbi:MAG TPA: hypothetical protein VLW06_12950, partial [Terriglobales bacterium]|nr:hypothetical protein [Terriglobales bacterium]